MAKLFISACTLASLPLAVAAQSAPAAAGNQSLDQVVVAATRSPQPISSTLADVTVIDSQRIADAGASTLPQLLQSAAGVEISESGGAGKVSGLFVRGTSTAQSIVFVDGVRIENPLSGGGNLEFLPLSAIDRIEIVRGPSSAFYGSGAVGGVIQISTRRGEGPVQAYGSVGYGSLDTSRINAGIRGAVGADQATRFSLAVANDHTRGFDATRPDSPNYQLDRDGNRQWNVTGSLSHRLTTDWELGATLLSTDGRARYDDAFSTPATALEHYASRGVTGFVKGRIGSIWQTQLQVGQTRLDYTFDAFTFAPRTRSNTLFWSNTFTLPVGRLLAGYEQLSQHIDGDGVTRGGDATYLRASRATRSLYAGYEVEQGAQLFRVQVRRDDIDTVGIEPTGSVAYGYRLDQRWLVRASFGTAFRAPTFDDLYSPFGANPQLKPEKSRGVELAIERREAARLFKATAFANRIRDAIVIDANFVPQNISTAKIHGVTFEAQQPLSESLALRGNVTLQHAEGEQTDPATGITTDQRLARRARRFGTAALDWHQGSWRASLQWLLAGDRVDTGGQALGGYGVLNLNGAYRVNREWEVFAMLNNLSDKDYQTAYGYNSAPRTVFVGVRYGAL